MLFEKHLHENNRLRRGHFSVRRSRREARFLKTSWPRVCFSLVLDRMDELFEKHLHKNDVFQFGREERRPLRKRLGQGFVLVWWSRGGACSLKNIFTKMMFFSLVDTGGVLLENRLKQGRFSVRWSRRAGRFLKNVFDDEVFQSGRREEHCAF